jgi:hypothetical protein
MISARSAIVGMVRSVGFEEVDYTNAKELLQFNTEELSSEDLELEKHYAVKMKNPLKWNLLNTQHQSSWLSFLRTLESQMAMITERREECRSCQRH